MYWFMSGTVGGWLLLFVFLSLISIGGWFIASHSFRLQGRERLISGIGIGLVCYIFFTNILGQILSPGISFYLAGLLVVVAGLIARYADPQGELRSREVNVWPLLILLFSLTALITLIGRGIAIFDDRKNLSIISTMAAGDIPPHFYMNPDYLFNYHYGFQLFAAGLMRVGGLFPWSAFDLGKGIVSALAIILAGVWGWRVTHSKGWAAATGLLLALSSGSRWLLNFLPLSILQRASVRIDLWGASDSTVRSLINGLSQSWAIDGGPPLALPFAYVNGILQPFVLKLHKGPIGLGLVILILMLLLIGKNRSWPGFLVLCVLSATWGLTAEAEFILFGFGVLAAVAFTAASKGMRSLSGTSAYIQTLLAMLIGGVVSLVQGGTITEMAKGIVGISSGSGLGGGTGLGGFQFRWPPAIVSAHLGELRLTNGYELLVGLLEIGPAILAGILVLFCIRRWLQHDRLAEAALALGSYAGFILPLFLRYTVDRDITRMSAFALLSWILLAVPILAILMRRMKLDWLRIAVVSWSGALIFGGLVVTGSLFTAIPKAIFSYQISDLDVHMTRQVWDELPQDALIMSSHEWLVVPVTGRLTRTFADNTTPLDEWLRQLEDPDPRKLENAGFDYVYVDEAWWQEMPADIQDSYSKECGQLVAEVEDTSKLHFRRLFDISHCSE
ncbi:MAG: hypothetical protein PVF85_01210 [Anaerolineales bacterium]|jgi:hypothetical protein